MGEMSFAASQASICQNDAAINPPPRNGQFRTHPTLAELTSGVGEHRLALYHFDSGSPIW